jgi:hypothetical protein
MTAIPELVTIDLTDDERTFLLAGASEQCATTSARVSYVK